MNRLPQLIIMPDGQTYTARLAKIQTKNEQDRAEDVTILQNDCPLEIVGKEEFIVVYTPKDS